MAAALASLLRPCGPPLDNVAGQRALETLVKAAERDGWAQLLSQAQAALRPVFAASPYLAGLATRSPDRLRQVLDRPAEVRLAEILAAAADIGRAGFRSHVSRQILDLCQRRGA